MVKPSQWTAREAWSRAVKEVIDALGPTPSMVHAREWLQRCAFPFPADPPERVRSEWTPQEAHERLRTIVVDHLNQAGFYPTANSIRTSTKFDFPSDPPERVSDAELTERAEAAYEWNTRAISAAISAAVQAEREAIIQFAEYAERVAREKPGEHWEGRSCASFAIANYVRSRGPAPAVVCPECDGERWHEYENPLTGEITNRTPCATCNGAEEVPGPAPAVDVLGIVREYVEASEAFDAGNAGAPTQEYIAELRERITRLKQALAPFAQLQKRCLSDDYRSWWKTVNDDSECSLFEVWDVKITAGDIRNAAKAIEE